MKKKALSFTLFFFCSTAIAQTNNPFFGKYKHQIGFGIGAGVDSGFIVPPPLRPAPFAEIHARYSVPTSLFYIPSRFSLNVSQTIGLGEKYGWNWDDYSIPIIYLDFDAALYHNTNWIFGAGAGGGFQVKENERIGSKLLFVFKIFARYKLTETLGIEVNVKHFSNGNTAPENNSYAFYGLDITYNF